MILTRHNAAFFLINQGLLDTRSLVDNLISIRSHSQRNRGFSVLWPNGQGYYIKQHQPDAGPWEKCSSIAHEAGMLRRLAELPQVPCLRVYDSWRQALVMDWLAATASGHERALVDGQPDVHVAQLLGSALGRLHRDLAGVPADDLAGAVPWIIRIDRLYPLAGEDQSWGQARLVALVQSLDACMAVLAGLASHWPGEHLIHGDMKWQNCRLEGQRCVFIDWEMADRGDPLWDLAGLCQSWLKAWMDHQPTHVDPVQAAEDAAEGFVPYQRALARLWASYCAAVGAAPDAERLVVLCGARLLQTLYEDLAGETDLSAAHTLLLQLASNLLLAPQAVARDWWEDA